MKKFLLAGLSFIFFQGTFYFPIKLPTASKHFKWAICLDVEYIEVETENKLINLAKSGHPKLEVGEVWVIKDPKRSKKLSQLANLKAKDKIYLLSKDGTKSISLIKGFAYYKPAPATIFTLALLEPLRGKKLKSKNWVLAWKDENFFKEDEFKILILEPENSQLCSELLKECSDGLKGEIISDKNCYILKNENKLWLFVSFWHHPSNPEDIEDWQTSACFSPLTLEKDLKPAHLPAGISLESAFLANDKIYLIGSGGNGAEVCRYLVSWTKNEFKVIKKGACLGY